MTYFETRDYSERKTDPKTGSKPGIKTWLDMPALQMLLSGVYFLLGLSGVRVVKVVETHDVPVCAASRVVRRKLSFQQRKGAVSRGISVLRPLMTGGTSGSRVLTRTQFLERCTRLSAMGRLQIYNFQYYRWEFWRKGALKTRGRAPQGACGPVPSLHSCGLSSAHLWPD